MSADATTLFFNQQVLLIPSGGARNLQTGAGASDRGGGGMLTNAFLYVILPNFL